MVYESGKKRSFSQRVGTAGENEFRNFALRQGLIPTKSEEDFGTDFFCLVDLNHRATIASSVGNVVISACVRATTRDDGRVKLTRADAQYLLRARDCVFFCLIDVKPDRVKVYYKFIDIAFAVQLTRFLRKNNKTYSITPGDCFPESNFRNELLVAAQPGYAESVAVQLAERGLIEDVPNVTVHVNRDAAGAYTLVSAFNFYDFFDQLGEDEQQQLYEATFGVPQTQQERMAKLALREGLIENISRLPQPFVLAGFTSTRDVLLRITNPESVASCMFTRTANDQHFGWINDAGVSVTVSYRRLVNGEYIHETRSFFDPYVATEFGDVPEVTKFLAAAVAGAILGDGNDFRMELDYFPGLLQAGEMARSWELAKTIPGWRQKIFFLRDIYDEESSITLSFLGALAKNPRSILPIDFVLSKASLADPQGLTRTDLMARFTTRPGTFLLPIMANTKNVTIIVNLTAHGVVYRDEDRNLRGLRVEHIDNVELCCKPLAVKSTIYPEIIAASYLPTLPMGPDRDAEIQDMSTDTEITERLGDIGVRVFEDEE